MSIRNTTHRDAPGRIADFLVEDKTGLIGRG
jgi:hypothetical protein